MRRSKLLILPNEIEAYISSLIPLKGMCERHRQYIAGKRFIERYDLDHVEYCAAVNALADRLGI